jgi:phosphatidate cytidylyltransferase
MAVENAALVWLLNSLGELRLRLLSAILLLGLVSLLLFLGPPYTLVFIFLLTLGLGAEVTTVFMKQSLPRKGRGLLVAAFGAALLFCMLLSQALLVPGGVRVLVWVCLSVWTADSLAYGVGRLLGGPRLAPRISPGKTWSGFLGGVGGGGLIGLVFLSVQGISLTWPLVGLTSWVVLSAQAGDLLESAAKRFWGIKDSGFLIPGHGGLWDRLDGLLFAVLSLGLLSMMAALGGGSLVGGSYVAWVQTFF